MINKHLHLSYLLVFFLFFSCKNDSNTKKVETSNKLTPREIGDFGFKVEQAITNTDTSDYYQLIQPEFIENQSLNKVSLSGDTLDFLKTIVENKINQFKKLSSLPMDAIVELAKVDTSKKALIYSIFTGGRNLDFIELNLERNNGIKVTDFTFYTHGNSYKKQVQQTIKVLSNKKISQEDNFPFGYTQLNNNLYKLQATVNQLDEIDDSAISVIQSIPEELLYLQEVNNTCVYMANINNDILILDQLIKIKIQDSNNENAKIYLKYLISSYNSEFADGISELKSLDSALNQNSYINYLIGTLYYEMYDFNNAIEYYNTAISDNPEVFDFHFAKVVAYIEMNEFDKAVESLLVMDDYFTVNNINWDKEFLAYPEFLTSDSYFIWQERISEKVSS